MIDTTILRRLSATIADTQAFYRVALDGVPGGGTRIRAASCYIPIANKRQSVSLIAVAVSVPAGAHTVRLQWRSDQANHPIIIDQQFSPDTDHVSFIVQEVPQLS